MELTDVERVILIRQCSILQMLEQEDEHDKDFWDRAIEVLENGYTELYDQYLPHLEKPLPVGVYQFVCDVLNTYDGINAYKANHPEDTEVAEDNASMFPGFSGNYEIEYLALASFFAKTQRSFLTDTPLRCFLCKNILRSIILGVSHLELGICY